MTGGSPRPSFAQNGKGRWGRSVVAAVLALFGLGGGFAAQAKPAAAPPPDWIAYAEQATRLITDELNSPDAPAPRLRTALDATRPAADQPAPPLVLKIWIDRDGALTRVDHGPFSDGQADADLKTLLVGRHLGRPPHGMLLPIRIAIQLAPPGEESTR
jgi:hypothetical protein